MNTLETSEQDQTQWVVLTMASNKNFEKLEQEYQEEFYRPQQSIPLLTEHEAHFIRALARLNYFKKDKQDEAQQTTSNN